VVLSCVFAVVLICPCLFAATRGIKVEVKTPQGKTISLYRDSYALLVGNASYEKGWDSLPGAIRDVEEVAEALERNGFKVLLETNLTKDAFDRVLAQFALKYGRDEDNRLLFYYAGHGYTQKMATGEELGYLVMIDAPIAEKDPVGFDLKSVDMQTLVTHAKKIRSRHVLFMFDSCFSGSILNMRDRVVPQNISDNVKYPVRQFITAGRANEPVPDYSVFKQAFLDLLEGRDREPIPDGYITGEELGLYLKTIVPEYNGTQHPQYGKIRDPRLDKGDFVFVLSSLSTSEKTIGNTWRKKAKALEEDLKFIEAEAAKADSRVIELEAKRKAEEIEKRIVRLRRKIEEAERRAKELKTTRKIEEAEKSRPKVYRLDGRFPLEYYDNGQKEEAEKIDITSVPEDVSSGALRDTRKIIRARPKIIRARPKREEAEKKVFRIHTPPKKSDTEVRHERLKNRQRRLRPR